MPGEDLTRVAKATGGRVQTSTNKLTDEMLGTCALFEERQIGKERYNFFTGCEHAKTATVLCAPARAHPHARRSSYVVAASSSSTRQSAHCTTRS